MTDQNDFQSLDELFNSTFKQLPDSPSATGWDQPSPKVWEHVSEAIQPKGGFHWRWQYSTALAAAALVTMAALYFTDPAPQPAGTPASEQAASNPIENTVQKESASAQEAAKITFQPPSVPLTSPSGPSDTPAPALESNRVELMELAQPLPGTEPLPPNTTERKRQEEHGIDHDLLWTNPLPLLPTLPLKTSLAPKKQ